MVKVKLEETFKIEQDAPSDLGLKVEHEANTEGKYIVWLPNKSHIQG